MFKAYHSLRCFVRSSSNKMWKHFQPWRWYDPATKVTSKSSQVSQSRHCLGESLAQSDSKHLGLLFEARRTEREMWHRLGQFQALQSVYKCIVAKLERKWTTTPQMLERNESKRIKTRVCSQSVGKPEGRVSKVHVLSSHSVRLGSLW